MNKYDLFMQQEVVVQRLLEEHQIMGTLIIAVDFDSTVYDHQMWLPKDGTERKYDLVRNIIKFAAKKNFCILLYTARDEKTYNEAVDFMINTLGIPNFFKNYIPWQRSETKPFFNILLDDRAGLFSSYLALDEFFVRLYGDEYKDYKNNSI